MLVCFSYILKLLSSLFIILPFPFTGANCEESSSRWRLYPYAATDYGDILINRENWCFHINGLIVAISEEMDMLWFARSLVNMGIISSTGDYMIYPIPFADRRKNSDIMAERMQEYIGWTTDKTWGFFDVQSGFFLVTATTSRKTFGLMPNVRACSVLHMMVKPMDMSAGKTAFSKFPVYLNKSTQPVFITDSPLKTLHLRRTGDCPRKWNLPIYT